MTRTGRTEARLIVIKVGGGLSALPGALEAVCGAVSDLGRARRVVVVPGGGPFADAIRTFEAAHGLSADAAHWMAILAMEQYAHVLAERIVGARMVEEPGAIEEAIGTAGVAVLAPSRWMRAADVLPHTWEATSDSVAAFVAGALDAERLILVKPAAENATSVDPCFRSVLPAGLPYTVLPWDRVGELAQLPGAAS
ncbi:MAG: aspartate kinase [Gemmatimonadales bacterium]